MIDYIRTITSFDGKDSKFITHSLIFEAEYQSGWQKYYLEGCNRLAVWIHQGHQLLRIEGSIAYYWQGHNFTFSKADLVDAVQYINNILGFDIWKAEVNAFEYGVIMPVGMKPKEYIKHHSESPKSGLQANEKARDNGNFKWWEDKSVKLKMYDAGRNIQMKQGMNRKQIIEDVGWTGEGDFLKWEAHYIKPEILNRGKAMKLYNLVNPDWQNIFKEDLYMQYQRLIPMKGIITPTNKKELTTADLLMLVMAEDSINEGKPIEGIKRLLYDKINSIPDEVLPKADKDARKAQVKKLLAKIKEAPESRYDLSKEIQQALETE